MVVCILTDILGVLGVPGDRERDRKDAAKALAWAENQGTDRVVVLTMKEVLNEKNRSSLLETLRQEKGGISS